MKSLIPFFKSTQLNRLLTILSLGSVFLVSAAYAPKLLQAKTLNNSDLSHAFRLQSQAAFPHEGGINNYSNFAPIRDTRLAQFRGRRTKVTQLFDSARGALPLTSTTFTTQGGTLIIFASGSGFTLNAADFVLGMNIQVDGSTRGSALVSTNETISHKAFTTNALVVPGIASGAHRITLTPVNQTVTDGNDFFNVTVFELLP